MKKKLLAVALSCATMAMAVMPSAFADETTGSSGQITDSSGIVLTTGEGHGTFSLPSVASIDLTSATNKCYFTATSAGSLTRYFTVTDTDTANTHLIQVEGEVDADTSDDGYLTQTSEAANAVSIPITDLDISLESTNANCGSAATETRTEILSVVAGNGVPGDIALSGGWASGSTSTYLSLTGSAQTLLTGTPNAPIQYKFAPRSIRIKYPQDGTANTYTTTMVFSYLATT